MSSPAPFSGIDVLGPGEPLSRDGYRFQGLDRLIIDRILRVGAVTHRHDGHLAMADPATEPTVTTLPTGGSIPAGTAIYVTYTLLDADGGESLPVGAVTVTTSPGYADPFDMPTAVVSHAAGTLLANNYAYAVTVSDGRGGETGLSPAVLVLIPSGHPNSEVLISGLAAIVADSSGGDPSASWRLWRVRGGGPWYLIGTGIADTLTDNGIAGDCSVSPPDTGTTVGASKLSVTVPSAGQPGGAVNFSIYASLDGSFTNPSQLGTYPVADFDAAKVFTDLAFLTGAPPTFSTCLPGANPITAADLALSWLPPVADAAALPTVGNEDGDVRVALDTYTFYVWRAGLGSWVSRAAPVTSVFGRTGAVVPLAGDYTAAQVGAFPADVPYNTPAAGAYAFALADVSTVVGSTNAGAVTYTLPPHATTAFPVGCRIRVYQQGAGQVTIAGGAGVTLEARGGLVHTNGQFAMIELYQRTQDTWAISGDMA